MIFDICSLAPPRWKTKSISDICKKVTSGGTPSRSKPEFYLAGTIPWIKTKELENTWIYDTEEKITKDAVKNSSAQILPKNTVLLAMYGATVGELGILAEEMTCNQACCALIVDDNTADFRYLFYLLLLHKNTIKSLATGAAQQNLSAAQIKEFTFPFPELDDQHAIADHLFKLDEKIELNKKIIQTLEQMTQAIFKSWFVDFDPVRAKMEGRQPEGMDVETAALFPDEFEGSELGHIPKGWTRQALSIYLDIKRGGSPRPIQDFIAPTGYPWVKIADATSTDNPFLFSTKECIRKEGLRKTVLLQPGSLILSNSATPGLPRFLELEACIHDGWLYFPKVKLFTKEYLYLLFQTQREHFISQGNGSIFTNLKTDILKNYLAVIPSKECISAFNKIIDPIFEAIKSNTKQIHTLSSIRDSLLPKLLSGELTLTNFSH